MKIKYPELPEGYEWICTSNNFITIFDTALSGRAILYGDRYKHEGKLKWDVYSQATDFAKGLSKQQAVNFMANCVNLGMLHEDKVS